MFKNYNQLFLIIFLLLTTNIFCQSLYNGVGHIPSSCYIDWSNAGLYNSIAYADNLLNITDSKYTGDWDKKVEQAIAEAESLPGITIIFFPKGTYTFYKTINLSSNIILQGEGISTKLYFYTDKWDNCINIHGGTFSNEVKINSNIGKKDKVINDVANTTSYDDNPWVQYIEKTNPDAFYDNSYSNLGQISKVTNKTATTITVKDEASKLYKTDYNLYLRRLSPIENVGIENLKIHRQTGGRGTGSTVNIRMAVNCWVKGVETSYATGRHFTITNSAHIEISGCYIHHAYHYDSSKEWSGNDGLGYGIVLGESAVNCLIENNIFKKTRHAMLVGTGANTNVFTYNYSREPRDGYDDLTLHGRYPFANLFEHNWIERIEADDTHGKNGPYNAFVRNMCKDKDGIMHYMTLIDAPLTTVLGNELRLDEFYTPIITVGATSLSIDLYGILIYKEPPYNTYETGIMISHSELAKNWYYKKNYMHLHDLSYFYSERPYFLSTNYTFPSIGPEFTCQNIPSKDIYNASIKTYNTTPTQWPPQPLEVTITGPTSLNSGQSGTYTAHPSGGSGTYTDYEWWERKDDLEPYSVNGGNTILAPPSYPFGEIHL
ncbi:hypothetical protein ACX8XN_05540 [Calditrichota bacterium GD2]